MNNIRILTSLKEIETIKSEWNSLWSKTNYRTPYQRWEWNSNWIKSNRQQSSLYVIIVKDASGRPIGIAPMRRSISIMGFNKLTFISQEASNFPDFLIESGSEMEMIDVMLKHIHNNRNISALDLKIAEPSVSVAATVSALKKTGWYVIETMPYTKRLMVDIGNDYETYLCRLSGKMRQEIRGEVRKLTKLYDVDFVCSDGYKDFEAAMDILFYLNSLRWGGDHRTSHWSHRECYRALLPSEGVKIFTLLCNGKPVGALSALSQETTLFAEVAGFDYSVAKVDLGKVFYHYLFSWAVAAGYSKIDFSSGEEPYKLRYKPEVLTKWQIRAFRDRKSCQVIKAHGRVAGLLWSLKQKIAGSALYHSSGLERMYRAFKRKRRDQ